MSGSLLAPLYSIHGPLLQTLQTSYSYLARGTELMHDTIALDNCLRAAFVSHPAEYGTDVYLDCHRMDLNEARRLFLEIRGRREVIDDEYPLLSPAAGLLDYMAHMVTNILPLTEVRPRRIASVGRAGASFAFEQLEKRGVAWSMAIHFGISPAPLFGETLDLRDSVVKRELGRFGLGVYAYLGYTFVPALGAVQCLTPEIAREWGRRERAEVPLHRTEDGGYLLDAAR